MRIYLKRGSIAQERADAIVHPANSTGAMASGIGAALKNSGSASIEKDAKGQAPIPIGTAVLTSGYNLGAAHVLHAVTTTRIVEEAQVENIRKALHAALALAEQHGFVTLIVPGMGNSIGQAKKDAVAKVMVEELRAFPAQSLQEILLMPQDSEMEKAFHVALHVH